MLKRNLSLLLIASAILCVSASCSEKVTSKKKCRQDVKKVNKLKDKGTMAPGFK